MDKPQWVLALEAKHGLPIQEIPGTVYTLCYDPPTVVRSVSIDYAGLPPRRASVGKGFESAAAIEHHVGWTQQANPHRRIGEHHRAATPVTISLSSGTMRDEERLKHAGRCPTCGKPFADSLAAGPGTASRKPS